MHHAWRNLLFMHFPADPDAVRSLLPPGLDVDVFADSAGDLRAWLGFVPFEITSVEHRSGLRVPTASRFLETNVRTYVHRHGQEPAVWFFSLDAQSALACKGARLGFGLPYWHAQMSMCIEENRALYRGERRCDRSVRYDVESELLGTPTPAEPGTLEFFLAERYLLYSLLRGRLVTGRVAHDPYRLQPARFVRGEETFSQAARIASAPFVHAMFSPGVDVDVFGPENVFR